MSKRPELVIESGASAGKRYQVKDGGLRLGRSSSNDIHLPDEQLSRNHCLFEPIGEDGIRVTDLASANGTIVNGKMLGSDPVEIKAGDVIEVGSTVLRVAGDDPAPVAGKVDLGFGETPASGSPASPGRRRRSPLANVLWAFAILLTVAAGYVMFDGTRGKATPAAPEAVDEAEPVVQEVTFEKVEADSEGIFRYEMTLSPDGVLRVQVDDVPKENRHLSKNQPLGEAARKTINEILSFSALKDLDREYVGAEPDPPALKSWTLRVVYDTRVRSVRIVNTQEPEAFRAVRERLEAFSKNELGIWAMQYSRDRLVKLAEDAVVLGQSKYADRDVNFGNLAAAVAAFKEAIFYLETVNPKPDCHKVAQAGLETAVSELDRRYADQRFLADRACNLGQWDVAKRELGILLEMVPDRNDERNREATAKLLDVDRRMQKKGGK